MEQIVLLQLSDLHFADRAVVPSVHRVAPLRKHDAKLCQSVQSAVRQMLAACRANESCVWAMITGDVTGSGKDGQFAVAHTFLHSGWQLYRSRRSRCGLALDRERCLTIPGNHDHWRAEDKRYNREIYEKHFEPTPWRAALTSENRKVQVDLFGVDSCSGQVNGVSNLLAAGAISAGQFNKLEADLGRSHNEQKAGTHYFRAIACHHSLTRHRAFSWTRPLEDSSALELLRLADRYEVQALLTGHAHSVKMQPYRPGRKNVWELRCPTTLQARAKVDVQGFWMHRIFIDRDARPVWQAILFAWNGTCFCPWAPEVLD